MSNAYRTVVNRGTGETITFVETSEESGGARVVALITLAPGGAVTPHSHQVKETFECVEGVFTVHLGGRDMAFPAGASMAASPHQLHGFRNDTDVPATLKVTATPAGDLDRVLRTLCGLSQDGLLVPGKPPRHPLAMEPGLSRPLLLPAAAALALLGPDRRDGTLRRPRLRPDHGVLQPATGTKQPDRTLTGTSSRL
jgi:quercetin dioxygenase-like cupin family protein